jgi:SAM-dependent methyltransferase
VKRSSLLFSAFTILLGIVSPTFASRNAKEILQAEVPGGIVVHLGVDENEWAGAMAQTPRYLVHVLDTDQADIETARAEFDQLGVYGKASAETFDGTHLPYGDHTINAIVVNDPMQVPVEELDRVLAPGGVLMVRGEVSPDGIVPQKWDKIGPLGLWRKPWPETIDQWPQFLRDASGEADGDWSKEMAFQPRAMVLAADHLCLAGWTDEVVIEPKTGRALNPSQPDPHDAFLRIYSAESGELVSQQPLSTEPVFDGMAVVEGKLLLCLKNGEVLCLGK